MQSVVNKQLKKENTVARAKARHILVSSQEACADLKQQIESGKDFAEMAKEHSQCPSSQQGGDLGEFGPGQMVKEFDEVVFKEAVGAVHGPIQTQFGFHLVEITSRTE
jgi:peptidyl-prolyl cis-trans isomerase C